jgi:hypothetical protein
MGLLLGLKFVEILVESFEAFVPETAVLLQPVGDIPEGPTLQASGTPLRLATSGDQARALEHDEVLGNGGEAHPEGPGQLGDRRFARGESRENGASRGIGERREGGAEAIMRSRD